MDHRWTGWVHLMFSTRGVRLPGDPRGFRDHNHRIHSSGDYHHPPPAQEHSGLRRYTRIISAYPVALSLDLRARVAAAIIEKLGAMDCTCAILAVAPTHAHVLARVMREDARRSPAGSSSSRRIGSVTNCPGVCGDRGVTSCESETKRTLTLSSYTSNDTTMRALSCGRTRTFAPLRPGVRRASDLCGGSRRGRDAV